jgi:hypothetical protein
MALKVMSDCRLFIVLNGFTTVDDELEGMWEATVIV